MPLKSHFNISTIITKKVFSYSLKYLSFQHRIINIITEFRKQILCKMLVTCPNLDAVMERKISYTIKYQIRDKHLTTYVQGSGFYKNNLTLVGFRLVGQPPKIDTAL